MVTAVNLPAEITVLAYSVILLFVHIAIQGHLVNRERGLVWNAGPRDEAPPLGRMAGRAVRTLENYKETYPAFVALALALAVTDRTGGIAATGAWLWLGARVIYIPLYLFGVPWVRSAAYGVALAGLLMMLSRLI